MLVRLPAKTVLFWPSQMSTYTVFLLVSGQVSSTDSKDSIPILLSMRNKLVAIC